MNRTLPELAAVRGLADLARWLENELPLLLALVAWPPPPRRGRVYSTAERERLLRWVRWHPDITEFRAAVAYWETFMRAASSTFDRVWEGSMDTWRTVSERPQSFAAHVADLVADQLELDWPKGDARDQAWLRAWSARWIESALEQQRARLERLSDERVYSARTPVSWLLTESGLDASALGRVLRVVHGVEGLGFDGVPSVPELMEGRATWADVERALARRRRQFDDAAARETGEALTFWRVLSEAFRALPDRPGTRELARALPSGAKVDALERGSSSRRTWAIRVSLGGRRYLGPEAASVEAALEGLRELARTLSDWSPPASGDRVQAWRVLEAGARRELSDGRQLRNPPALAPAGVGALPELADAHGWRELGAWLRAHAPDVGATIFDQRQWKFDWPTGWTTTVDRSGSPSRVDAGALAPSAFEWLGAREGELGPDFPALQARVEALARGRLRQPIEIVREAGGATYILHGRQDAIAAMVAKVEAVPVLVKYMKGTEAYGLLVDPATGHWDPWPAGLRVRTEQGVGTVLTADELPDGSRRRLLVRLDDGRELDVDPRRAARLNELPRVFERLRTRVNPGRACRVAYDPRGRALGVRTPDGRARLVRRVESALLDGAELEGASAYGHLVAQDQGPPQTGARWHVVAGEPGVWAALRNEGAPGALYLTARPHGQAWASLYARPMRGNRIEAREREGEALFDAEGRRYRVVYQVVEAALDGSTVATSHQPLNLEEWTPGYPRDFQTRDLGSAEESAKIREIARRLDPERLLGRNLDATLGPPVAWEGRDERLYVLAGNGRALAILTAPEEAYERYIDAGRALLSCWPATPARPGHRWMLLRVVQGATREEASRLAAASQLSTAADEGRLGRALGLVRSLGLRLDDLPAIEWMEPVTAANVGEFARVNSAFMGAVLGQVDAARRQVLVNDTDRLAPVVEAVLLGFLPQPLQRAGLLGDPKLEDALLGGLPALATLRMGVQAREIFPVFDLLSALPAAVGVFAFLQQRRMSFRALEDLLSSEARTERLADAERLSETPPLALALAAALTNAARRAAPAVVFSDILRAYLEVARRFNPRQAGLFGGGPRLPDPADVLGELVPGFRPPARPRPNPARSPRVAGVVALLFSRARFPSASDARAWCKANAYHPGVPESVSGGWRVTQATASARPSDTASRQVKLDEGVTALV